MANQPDRRQQFRFWNPFWANNNASASPPRPSAPRPRLPPTPTPTPTPTPAAAPPTDKKTTTRTPSLSPSPSSSSSRSSSSSPAKQNQPKRSSLPSPTQSPSRRPTSRSDQLKLRTKDQPTQASSSSQQIMSPPATPSLSPSPSKGTDKSPQIQDPKTIEPSNASNVQKPTSPTRNGEKQLNNASHDLEKVQAKSIHFDPLTGDMPTQTVMPDNENPTKSTGEHKLQKDDQPKSQVQLDAAGTINDDSETRPEQKKQAHDKTHQEKSIPDDTNRQTAPAQDDNLKETVREIARPVPDGSQLNEKIKEMAQSTSDGNDLSSNHESKTVTMINHNNSGNNTEPTERENQAASNPRQKEKIMSGPSSTRTSFHKNIKDGISKLAQKVNSTGNALSPGISERGASIITLAGENKGASMYIGHENEGHNSNFAGRARKLNESSSTVATSSKGKENIEIQRDAEIDEKDSKIAANVNSNVQSINNSMLQESSCDTRDPGVHLRFSSRLVKHKDEEIRRYQKGNNIN